MLSIRALSKTYDGPRKRMVLTGVDLELATGEYVAVMGESGIGKSTLLNLIAGLERPDAGIIEVDGVDLARLDDDALTRLRGERMGFVFQAFHILPYLSVGQNVELPLRLQNAPVDEAGLEIDADAGSCRARRIALTACRANCQVASCNGSQLHGRSLTGRNWCWLTSQPAISIRTARATCWTCCGARSKRTTLQGFW